MTIEIKGPKFNLQLWTDHNITILRRNGTGRSISVGEFNVSLQDGVQFCNLEGPRKDEIDDPFFNTAFYKGSEKCPLGPVLWCFVMMDRQGGPY